MPTAKRSAMPAMTARAAHLLSEIAAGRDRIFATDAKPPGFATLMQFGYATRIGTERAAITATGRAFLAGIAYVAEVL